MTERRIGYFLSAEEHSPADLVRAGRLAGEAGFTTLSVSDHFHPWIGEQGESPFVWSVLGALSEVTSLPVMTAVTCPTIRVHPAVVAQAAATTAVQHEGRFVLGVGSGERLNERVLGDHWPATDIRLEMLEEAVALMRRLWTGETVHHRGVHYRVEDARLWTVPPEPPKVYVSAYGPKAVAVAARIGDGLVTTKPDPELVRGYRDAGGTGPAVLATKMCWGPDEAAARRTAHRVWPNDALPGELASELPSPRHFEQAVALVSENRMDEAMSLGPDTGRHVERVEQAFAAGFDEVHLSQVGSPDQAFFDWARDELLPALR